MAGLVDLLAEEVVAATTSAPDGTARRVILWLDPHREFSRLWPHVADTLHARSVPALACGEEGDQIRIKVELLRLEGRAEPVVVYLPGYGSDALQPSPDGSAPQLWSVYEYRYKGALWTLDDAPQPGGIPDPPSLLGWLGRLGVRTVDEDAARELAEGGGDSLLARYAELHRHRPPSAWPTPLKVSEVVAALGGDPRDALRELLAAPGNALRSWGERAELVLAGIEASFGLRPPAGESTPEEFADSFATGLALAEAWDALGRAPDFPFRTRLPASDEQRERAARFLRDDVLSHVELRPRYRERIAKLEKEIDLTKWAEGRPGLPRGLPLLARSRWAAFLERFGAAAAEDWRKARDLLLASGDEIAAGCSTPWDGPGGDSRWFVIQAARFLAERCLSALEELRTLDRARGLVSAYAERWCDADRLHLAVRAGCSRSLGLEHVRRVADLTYFAYVEEVNDRLSELVEGEGTWPPAESVSVRDAVASLWERGSGRRAVIVSDALRWDLGRELSRELGAEITPVVSTLPTTTPFGMTALLPIEPGEVEVAFEGAVSLRTDGGANLATREGRKTYLAQALKSPGGKDAVAFVDMEDVLKDGTVPVGRILVVFDDTIDGQGHKGTEELPGLAEELIGKLRRTVERLHEAGIREVHVVTDHGFLLLPRDMVDGLGRPKVELRQALRREPRWCALKPGAPVGGLVRLPLPAGDGDVVLGFPRGVRTLVAAEDFLHGGVSLQEVVIPHVVSKVSVEVPRLDVDVTVGVSELVTGTVPVVVHPLPAGLFGQRPVTLRLWVEAAENGEVVTDPVEFEVRPDVDELKPPLYLKEGAGLRAGAELLLRAVATETEREVASVPLRMAVDWE